jgi:surface antigen
MKKVTLFFGIFFLTIIVGNNCFAYNNHGYPYSTTRGCTDSCYPENIDVFKYGFCRNNCTSYVAYVLNEVYGIPFYNNNEWHDGGNWGSVAKKKGIPVDNYPIPGDVAWWNSGAWGHVAFVEKVHYNSNGNPEFIDVTEYNFRNQCDFGYREKISANDPTGFIHILAYNEGVKSLHYLDCYEMNCPGQTQQEWNWIANKVWNEYRCKNCSSNYSASYVNSIAGGFGGSGSSGSTVNTQTSKKLPNLHIEKFFIRDSHGNELNDNGSGVMHVGEEYEVHIYPESLKEDCLCGIEKGKDTVETDTYWKIGSGDWKFLHRNYTQCKNMDEDDSKKETFKFVVPWEAVGKSIYLKAKVDATKEVDETNENDNWCDTERYGVEGNCEDCPDLVISRVALTNNKTELELGEKFGLEMNIFNQGSKGIRNGIRSAYYLKSPSQSSWHYVMDDGSDASDLGSKETQYEYTTKNPFTASEAGIWQGRACADYKNTEVESDENNNCKEFSFEVTDPSIIIPDPILNSSCEYFDIKKVFHAGLVDIWVIFKPELQSKIHVVGQTNPNDYWDNLPIYSGELCFQNWPTDASPEFAAYYVDNSGNNQWLVAKKCSQFFNGSSEPNAQHFIIYSNTTNAPVETSPEIDTQKYDAVENCQFFKLQKTFDIGGKVNYQIIFSSTIPSNLGFVGQKAPDDAWVDYPVSSRTIFINNWPKGQPIEFAVYYFDTAGNKLWLVAKDCPVYFNNNPDPNNQHFVVYLE